MARRGADVTPTDKIAVTLEAQNWETVMRVLSEAPYRVVAPLIGEIQSQCMREQAEQPNIKAATEA
jgi:hypothetical protein